MSILYQKGFADNWDQESKLLWKIATTALSFRITLNYDFFSSIPNFPECPWLELSAELRSNYLDTVASLRKGAGPPHSMRLVSGEELDNLNWPVWNEAQRSIRPDSFKALLEIPAGISKKDVLDQIANFLQQIAEQNEGLFSANSGGRGGAHDKLRQLGAYRLLQGRSPTEAFNFVRRHKNQKGELFQLYDEASQGNAWYRARDDAKIELEQFNEVAEKLVSFLKI
jgi:hypothetical protein